MHKQQARQNLIDALRMVVDALGPIYALKRRDRREPGRKEKEQAEERFALLMRRHFRRQWARVREQLGEQYPDRKSIKAVDIPDDDDLEDLIRALTEMLRGGVALFGSRAKPAIDYTLTNKEAAQAAREYAYDLVRGINDTTRDALSSAVTSFVETPGMTLGDLEDQVSVHFGEGRAERIAITEVTRAYATGQQMAGEALRKEFPDVRVVKVWFTNADDIVCPVCAPLDGKEVGINESFTDDIDNPPAHPNCRCWTESTTALAELGEQAAPAETVTERPSKPRQGENTEIGKLPNGMPVYRVEDATTLMENRLIAVAAKGGNKGTILASPGMDAHAAMVDVFDKTDIIDNYVRLVNYGGRLEADTRYATHTGDNEDAAINNIYKALDRLVGKGLSSDTPVVIYLKDKERLFTTAKMCRSFLRSMDYKII
jgi:hypothetical protein